MNRLPTVPDLLEAVCSYVGVESVEVEGECRRASVVKARQIVFWLAEQLTLLSRSEIGTQVNGSHWATVTHGIKRVESGPLKEIARKIKEEIDNRV